MNQGPSVAYYFQRCPCGQTHGDPALVLRLGESIRCHCGQMHPIAGFMGALTPIVECQEAQTRFAAQFRRGVCLEVERQKEKSA